MSEGQTADLGAGLKGQRVLVTAGAAGIGHAIAGRLIAHGARVFVCDVADAALEAFAAEFPQAGRIKADVAAGRMSTACSKRSRATSTAWTP
jgi:NAD(P)-dependent dehydrogenase (short-subunit alcohol dehydrogenase family)